MKIRYSQIYEQNPNKRVETCIKIIINLIQPNRFKLEGTDTGSAKIKIFAKFTMAT